MAGTVWIPEAEQLHPLGASGDMLGGPPRVVWHTTEAPSGGDYFRVMDRVLTSKQAEPHILWDPLTDRLGQYFPLNRSSRALRNDAATGTSTNKTGVACIQIEVVAYASKPFTAYWQPGPNFAALMRAIRSWGIPDLWPAGSLSRGGEGVSRSLTVWKTQAGHFGHCNVPGNTHWDPGAIDQAAIASYARPPVVATKPQEDDTVKYLAYRNASTGDVCLAAPGQWYQVPNPAYLKLLVARGVCAEPQDVAANEFSYFRSVFLQSEVNDEETHAAVETLTDPAA